MADDRMGDKEFVQSRWQNHRAVFRAGGFVPAPSGEGVKSSGGVGFAVFDRVSHPPTYFVVAVSAQGAVKALRGDLADDRAASGDFSALANRILAGDVPDPPHTLAVDEALRLLGLAGQGPGGLVELSLRRFASSLGNARLAARLPLEGLGASETKRFEAAGLAAVRARLDPAALEALASAESFHWKDYSFYAETGEKGAIRRAAAAHFPLFATFFVARFSVRMAIDAQVTEKRRNEEYLLSDEYRDKLTTPTERNGQTRTLEEWMRADGRDPQTPWQLSEKTVRQALQGGFGKREEDGQPNVPMHVFTNLRGVSWPTGGLPIERVVTALSELPPDWMPKTRLDWDAFCDLTATVGRLLPSLSGTPLRVLYEGCGGKWAELRERMIRAFADTRPPEGATEADAAILERDIDWEALKTLPASKVDAAALTAAEALEGIGDNITRTDIATWAARRVAPDVSRDALRGACQETEEMVDAFAAKVVLPLAAHEASEHTGAQEHMLAEQHHVAARQAAARLLLPGKSAVRLFEATRAYINRGAEIAGAGEDVENAQQIAKREERERRTREAAQMAAIGIDPDAPIPEDGWAPLTGIVEAPNGVWIVPLTNPLLLADEGRGWGNPQDGRRNADGSMGLGICVGTAGNYASRCQREGQHILSFRSLGGEEGAHFTRLSCLQVGPIAAGSPEIKELQHRGQRNGAVPEEAKRALEWYKAQLRCGAITINYDAVRAGIAHARAAKVDEVALACGYDWKSARRISAAMAPWAPFVSKKHRKMGPDQFARDPDVLSVVEAIEPGLGAAAARAPGL
jgi:hypothetical protein